MKKQAMKKYLKAQYLVPVTAFFILVLYAFFIISGSTPQTRDRQNSYNKDHNGYFLFYNLFRRLDYKFHRWFKETPPEKGGCLFYFDYYGGDKKTVERLTQWVSKGNTLFLVGINTPVDPVFARQMGFGLAERVAVATEISSEPISFYFRSSRTLIPESGDTVLLHCESGALMTRHAMGAGHVYLVPDNRLFINGYFVDSGHAVFLSLLLKKYFGQTFYVYEYGTGLHKVNNPVMILFKGNFAYLTFHLLLMGLVFVLFKGKRFGSPLPADPFKRRTLTAHLTAVAGFYQKSGAFKIAGLLLRKYLIYRSKNILNIKKQISTAQLAELLARHTGKSKAAINGLLDHRAVLSDKNLFFKRREIHDLITELKACKRLKKTINPVTPGGGPVTPAGNPVTPAGNPVTPAGNPVTPAGSPVTPAGSPVTPAGAKGKK
ncbi:MAG: DUF4350 domain-containing protein [bacterium]|nr:DUF4350 domain-containing protein [bacterium]